jgi:uncharacterized protein Yka (UPF0111/DUF47 family)
MLYKFSIDVINNVDVSINADSKEDAIKKLDYFKQADIFEVNELYRNFNEIKSHTYRYLLKNIEELKTVRKEVDVAIHFDVDAIKTFEIEVIENDKDDLNQKIRNEIYSATVDDHDLDIQSSEVDVYDFEIESIRDCEEEVTI